MSDLKGNCLECNKTSEEVKFCAEFNNGGLWACDVCINKYAKLISEVSPEEYVKASSGQVLREF